MIWKRSVGFLLITFGLVNGFLPARNLWTVWSAWNDLDRHVPGGIDFLPDPSAKESLQAIWNENLLILFAMLSIVILGVIIYTRAGVDPDDQIKIGIKS